MGSDYAEGKGRNTPTCVGKTRRAVASLPCIQKHPHVRGEDLCHCPVKASGVETPPRAWGRRSISINGTTYIGNTPTCVGKT